MPNRRLKPPLQAEARSTSLLSNRLRHRRPIRGGLESAALVGGFSALGAALASIGIPENSVLQYEESVKAGKFLLVLHGTTQEVEHAKDQLDNTQATETTVHTEPVTVGV